MRRALTRREFLRAAAALGATVVAGCTSTPPGTAALGRPTSAATAGNPGVLTILQWQHFVPAYDDWFDNVFAEEWGRRNGIQVVVDHLPLSELPLRAAAEVTAQSGHDLVGLLWPVPAFEDEVIDHADVVREAEIEAGPMAGLIERSVYNPVTDKYFGFSDGWAPNPLHYRKDLLDQVGGSVESWQGLLAAAPALKDVGHPLGLGLSDDRDSNLALLALLHCFGASLQDAAGNVAIGSPESVEAVGYMTELFAAGMTEEVFGWDAASNNAYMLSRVGSVALNSLSILRAVERDNPELARNLFVAPIPQGPGGRLAPAHVVHTYVIWRFATNPEAAQRFLADLAAGYQEAFEASGFYNFPSFPGAGFDLERLLSDDPASNPSDKLIVLADAESWSTNAGHPGHTNAAGEEVLNGFIIPQMFARAARGEMSPPEAVRWAEEQISPIYGKWREAGKV